MKFDVFAAIEKHFTHFALILTISKSHLVFSLHGFIFSICPKSSSDLTCDLRIIFPVGTKPNTKTLAVSPGSLQGDYTAAMASLETCLSVLTRALPSTSLDLLCSLSWNVIRYCLHRPTPLGWLVHQVRGKHEGEEARTSARDAALVYHRLSQLQLTGECREQNVAAVAPLV